MTTISSPSSTSSAGVLHNVSSSLSIHDPAKALPSVTARKQNTACDACRSRKVKCNKLPNEDKCQHCVAKNLDCTHKMMQATTDKKKSLQTLPRKRTSSTTNGLPKSTSPSPRESPRSVPTRLVTPDLTSPSYPSYSPNSAHTFSHSINNTVQADITLNTWPSVTLAWLFAPPRDENSYYAPVNAGPSAYALWGEEAYKLADDHYRKELALDLMEVYFSIVHWRLPLLNPAEFRSRLNLHSPYLPSNMDAPLNPALVAVVVAWGAKFSEHALFVNDRSRRPDQRSIIANTLVSRARELAEKLRVNRVPTVDNMILCMLLESLQSQIPHDEEGWHGFWLYSAMRHLNSLNVHIKKLSDVDARGKSVFVWCMLSVADAAFALYNNKRPQMSETEYSYEEVESVVRSYVTEKHQLEYLQAYEPQWYLAIITRAMACELSSHKLAAIGMELEGVRHYCTRIHKWKEEYLDRVSIKSDSSSSWDFISAVKGCAGDANYHLLWIVFFNCLDDIGFREINELISNGSSAELSPNWAVIEQTKKEILEQAVGSALRIAALAGVMTENLYMRLDPAIMHVSISTAGTLLARLHRPEVATCIAALEQYSVAYEEAAFQAAEIKSIFARSNSQEFDFKNMQPATANGSSATSLNGSMPGPAAVHDDLMIF